MVLSARSDSLGTAEKMQVVGRRVDGVILICDQLSLAEKSTAYRNKPKSSGTAIEQRAEIERQSVVLHAEA